MAAPNGYLVNGDASAQLNENHVTSDAASLESWRTLLSQEQQKTFAGFRSEAVCTEQSFSSQEPMTFLSSLAVIEETLRLQQQQVHFSREEAELMALNARAERFLEEEQEQEHQDLLGNKDRRAEEDSERQSLKSSLLEHFVKIERSELRYDDLLKAHGMLQQQQVRLQRSREAFLTRMQQKEERQARERRELQAASARNVRNQQVLLEMELASLPESQAEVALKVHTAAAGQMRMMQNKVAEQLREMQLLQQRNGQKAFEFDQNCKLAQFHMEATHLAQMQKLRRDHMLQLAALERDVSAKLYTLKAQQNKEVQQLRVSNLRMKQKKAAKSLQRAQMREALARQEARKAGMEADFVEFLSVLQYGASDLEKSERTSSISNSFDTTSTIGWEDTLLQALPEDVMERRALEETEDSESALLSAHEHEVMEKEKVLLRQVEQQRQKQLAIEEALEEEHKQSLKNLQAKHHAGAAALQATMEGELKAMRSAHAMEKSVLQEAQDKNLENLKQTVELEHRMALINEEHKRNLSDFLSFICHELRNPLCGISACIELIQTHPALQLVDPEIVGHVDNMFHQSNQMKEIVNDVLDIRKIEEGKLEFRHVPFNIRNLVSEVVFSQRSYAAQLTNVFSSSQTDSERTKFFVNVSPEIMDVVVGDPTRLRQVISNLLSNAVKFTPKGSVILNARQIKKINDDHVLLIFEIKDTGVGISAQTVERLFNKYQQEKSKENPSKVAGTGLGLFICKSLVHQMGGEIGVTSELGSGSTFWFTLPFGKEGSERPLLNRSTSVAGASAAGASAARQSNLVTNGRQLPPATSAREMESDSESVGVVSLESHGDCRGDEADDAVEQEASSMMAASAEVAPGLPSPPLLSDAKHVTFGRYGEGKEEFGKLKGSRSELSALAAPFLQGLDDPTSQGGVPNRLEEEDKQSLGLRQGISRTVSDPGKPAAESKATGSMQSLALPPDLRVLLAEDSPMLQKTGAAMLQRLGIKCDVAADGEIALEMCQRQDYDVVLLDVQMPKYTGEAVAKILRQRKFEGGIVACTANAMPFQILQYKAGGMNEVLVKPFMLSDLSKVMLSVIPADFYEQNRTGRDARGGRKL